MQENTLRAFLDRNVGGAIGIREDSNLIRKFFRNIRNRLNRLSGPHRSTESGAEQAMTGQEATPPVSDETGEQELEAGKKKRRRPRRKTPQAETTETAAVAVEQGTKPVWDVSLFEVTPAEGKTRFHDFALASGLMHAIADLGFSYCTPIQAVTIQETLAGRDLVGRAQTGTGKTVAFLITIFQRFLDHPPAKPPAPNAPRALILAPTRELAVQITKEAQSLGRYCPFRVAAVFGGMDYQKQQQQLEGQGVDILVATPGRLLDFVRNRIVRLDGIAVLVIDEADRMLDMGFIPDVRRIVGHLPPKEERQTLLYSATINEDVKRLAFQWARNPTHAEIEPEQVAVETVEQIVYLTTAAEKYTILYNLITKQNLERVIIFTNRKDETKRLADRLQRTGINCATLSGDVAQEKRLKTLDAFRAGKIRVLVATDVAGRGVHIEGVSHVINYNLPLEAGDYVHRIGRTGRAGAAGISVSFAGEDDAFYLPEIEAYIGRPLPCRQPEDELLTPPPEPQGPPAERSPHRDGGYGGQRRSSRPRQSSPGSRRR